MKVVPVININGSDGASLLSQYVCATAAVKQAMEVVSAIDCHGRDYQTVRTPAHAGLIAREEMAERIRKLSTIHYELELIASSLQRQLDAHDRAPQPAA